MNERPFDWPDRIVLRDTKVYADEGQRIFTNATGYGYDKREYVRADIAGAMGQTVEAPLTVGQPVRIGGECGTDGRVTEVRDDGSAKVFYFNRQMQREEEYWFSRASLYVLPPHLKEQPK